MAVGVEVDGVDRFEGFAQVVVAMEFGAEKIPGGVGERRILQEVVKVEPFLFHPNIPITNRPMTRSASRIVTA